MSLDVTPPFRAGDNVYLELSVPDGLKGYYEAIVLDSSDDHCTLAAHMRATNGRPTWVLQSCMPQNSLRSLRRDPARIHNVVRGASCLYWSWDARGRKSVADAVVLDHRLFEGARREIRSLLDIAYRSPKDSAGWEIARNVARSRVSLGFSGGPERILVE